MVPGLQHKLPLGAVLGGSWGPLGLVMGGLGRPLGGTWATFLALGRSWRDFWSDSVAKALPRAIFFEFVLHLR